MNRPKRTRKPLFPQKQQPENVDLDDYCPISWNLLRDCKRIHKLDCGHTFDRGLLIQSLELSTLCPVCKVQVFDYENILVMSDGEELDESEDSFQPDVDSDTELIARDYGEISTEMRDFIVDSKTKNEIEIRRNPTRQVKNPKK